METERRDPDGIMRLPSRSPYTPEMVAAAAHSGDALAAWNMKNALRVQRELTLYVKDHEGDELSEGERAIMTDLRTILMGAKE